MTIETERGRSYPLTFAAADGDIEVRPMTSADAAAVLAFARRLPAHDLLFLRRDISQPKVVAAWVELEGKGAVTTLLATRGGEVLGCATLVRDPLSWSRHVGEMRVIVEPAARGKGLGQKLTQECFVLALQFELEKMIAQMTIDQREAIAVFEGMGFRAEALLQGHVKDREGEKHDVVILSHDVAKFQSRLSAYGLNEAF